MTRRSIRWSLLPTVFGAVLVFGGCTTDGTPVAGDDTRATTSTTDTATPDRAPRTRRPQRRRLRRRQAPIRRAATRRAAAAVGCRWRRRTRSSCGRSNSSTWPKRFAIGQIFQAKSVQFWHKARIKFSKILHIARLPKCQKQFFVAIIRYFAFVFQ